MSQVLSIPLSAGRGEEAMKQFLKEWQSAGSYSPTEFGYVLTAQGGERAMVMVEDDEL